VVIHVKDTVEETKNRRNNDVYLDWGMFSVAKKSVRGLIVL
jgi:hypothetical protein